jgi:hypothetical protein
VASTWKPTYLWLRTSRHWTKPLPINAYVIEHRDGIVLFDIGPGDTLTARLEAIGTTSPMCELRCCPISTRITSAGCRSSNAARGTDLALGASATLPRRGFRWPPAEQPAPPRASGRLHGGRVWLAPAVRAWRPLPANVS